MKNIILILSLVLIVSLVFTGCTTTDSSTSDDIGDDDTKPNQESSGSMDGNLPVPPTFPDRGASK